MLGAALTQGLAACIGGADEPNRPNVLLFSLDTLRADHVSCYGYERETTPNLDELAARSLLFERCYAGSAWTLSSHMTMLTGLFVEQHEVEHQDAALSPQVPLLAERLGQAGYQTHGLYFTGWIHPRHGFGRGFEVFEAHNNADRAEQNLLGVLDERDDRPWFLFLHLFDIHSKPTRPTDSLIYRPPAEYRDVFLEGAQQRFEPGDAAALWNGDRLASPEQIEALVALYDAGIRYVDTKLGTWLERLEVRGLLEGSIVTVTSDHGESLGQRGGYLRDHGGLFEEGLRVPLVVHRRDRPTPPARIARAVHHVDLVPSLLETVGLEVPDWLPGRSLFMEGAGDEPRVFGAKVVEHRARILYPEKVVDAQYVGRADYYVDLSVDPMELAPTEAPDPRFRERLDALEGRWQAELARWNVPGTGPIEASEAMGAAELEQLRALGYADQLDDAGAREE